MMNHQLYLSITILLVHLLTYIHSTDNIQNRSNWWKEVNSTVTDYVPSNTVRSLINSTISGSEYWHSDTNGQRSAGNRSEAFNELVRPDTSIVLPGRNGNAKVVRKIKRTFKNRTGKQANAEQSTDEPNSEWRENIVEPTVSLDHNPPTTTSSPITSLARSSTTTQLFQTTASDIDNLITSKVKWDDELQPPLSRSPIFKAKMNNQESLYDKYQEKFASIMPLPPPNADQQATTIGSPTESNEMNHEVNSSNNLQSSSHHSIVAPLSSANSNYFNFNSKVVHTLPASRSSPDKNQRKKQNKPTRNANRAKAPIQDFFLEADKVERKTNDRHVNPLKKTVDFTSRVNHEVTPNNNILAHLLKNNPFAIPIGKKTYKVTKKATTASTPNLPPTILTKRMNSPLKYATASSSAGFDSIGSSLRGSDEYTTTPMSALTNDNLDNINFKAKSSTQDYTWGRRVQASNNLISKTNSKANQLAKRNEWSGNDEQKDSINDKLTENNVESDEESVENDENTNEDTEPVNGEELNNEFNKNLAAIRNEESPKFDVVTFKPTNRENTNQVKGSLNVKSLPIQIISWRQAINHRKKGKETADDKPKPFAGERITSAKLVVRKEQQIEREKPSPKAFSKQTTKPPPSSTSAKSNVNTFKTTQTPKLITTTRSAYQSNAVSVESTGKRSSSGGKSTRSPMNAFGANRKMPQNEAYVAPQTTTKTKPAVSAQLTFQEYEDEKENLREELEENYVNRQVDLRSSPKKENRVKYAKNQEFRKKSLNLIEEKNENSLENNDQTETTKPIPVTSFKCQDQGLPGYYGDYETQCTVFHICQENNRKDSFFCPPGTAFNQQLLVCDWAANINCEANSRKPNPNANVFNNNNYESSNSLRNSNNYEVEDGLEEQKK